MWEIEVVIEPVLNRRPEPELRAWEELEDGARHDVRGRVPQRVEVFVAVVCFALCLGHRRCFPGTKMRLRSERIRPGREAHRSRSSTRVPPPQRKLSLGCKGPPHNAQRW